MGLSLIGKFAADHAVEMLRGDVTNAEPSTANFWPRLKKIAPTQRQSAHQWHRASTITGEGFAASSNRELLSWLPAGRIAR